MTLTELEGLVKNLIGEDVTDDNGTAALFTTPQLDQFLNIGNQSIWRSIVAASQSFFTKRSTDLTYVAATGGLSFAGTDVDAAGVYLLTDVEAKFQDRYFMLNLFRPVDRHLFEPVYIAPVIPAAYYIEAEKIVLTPIPAANQTLRLSYVPGVATMTADDQALSGLLTSFHPAVAYEAALMLLGKDESRSGVRDGVKSASDKIMRDLLVHVTRRSGQYGRKVRHVDFGS